MIRLAAIVAVAIATSAIATATEAPTRDDRNGSAFVVSADGYIVTSAHVVEGCSDLAIADLGPAHLVQVDRVNDLALLKVARTGLTPVVIRTAPPRLGETVYALGFPLADRLDNGLNFTNGLVSSLGGLDNDRRAIQFTAPIQPGNSGGPLVDASGALIGIVRAKLADADLLATKGVTAQNVSFAVRATLVHNFLEASGVPSAATGIGQPRPSVDVAEAGILYTMQVICRSGRKTAAVVRQL